MLCLAVLQNWAKFVVSGIFGKSAVNFGERNKESLGMRFIFLGFSKIISLIRRELPLEGKFYVYVLTPPLENTWHWTPRVSTGY